MLSIITQVAICNANFQHHKDNMTFDEIGMEYGLFGFNIGYHLTHHKYPNRHWSEYSNLSKHQRYKSGIIPYLFICGIWIKFNS